MKDLIDIHDLTPCTKGRNPRSILFYLNLFTIL
jgi:hypothetical protein